MSKEILLVYQDCPYCAPREEWGKAQKEIARKNGFRIKEVPFDTLGVQGVIDKAKVHGVNQLPFFTDMDRFTYNLADFVKKKERKKIKAENVAQKDKADNGDNPES